MVALRGKTQAINRTFSLADLRGLQHPDGVV
jgi:hypothetical protein